MRVPPYARNPIRFGDDGQTAFIGLTKGQEAVIDVGDVARVVLYRWYTCPDRQTRRYQAVTRWGYPGCERTALPLQRFMLDAEDDMMVEHIDHDQLNNRRANLRLVPVGENERQDPRFTCYSGHAAGQEGMTEFDRGYIAGIIISEGCFGGDKYDARLIVGLHARDPEPLLHLQRCLGGRIYGPYTHNGRHFRRWHLRGSELRRQLPFFDALLPPSHKREQYLAWKVKYGFTTEGT